MPDAINHCRAAFELTYTNIQATPAYRIHVITNRKIGVWRLRIYGKGVLCRCRPPTCLPQEQEHRVAPTGTTTIDPAWPVRIVVVASREDCRISARHLVTLDQLVEPRRNADMNHAESQRRRTKRRSRDWCHSLRVQRRAMVERCLLIGRKKPRDNGLENVVKRNRGQIRRKVNLLTHQIFALNPFNLRTNTVCRPTLESGSNPPPAHYRSFSFQSLYPSSRFHSAASPSIYTTIRSLSGRTRSSYSRRPTVCLHGLRRSIHTIRESL